MEMKQNKIKHFFYLFLSRTRVSTKLLRPFSLYLQHSKLKFCLIAIWRHILLVYGDFFTNQVTSFNILGTMATKMVTTWRVDRVQRKSFLQLAIRASWSLQLLAQTSFQLAPKTFWLAKLISQFLMLFKSLKSHHLPVGQVKNRIH